MIADTPPSTHFVIPECMAHAARVYHIPLRGFMAIWLTEGGKLGMQNKNKNGTIDYGPFQINTVWAKRIARDFGVTPELLTNDFCSAAMVSAYIIKFNIIQAGGDFWEGIGRYHSATPSLKEAYIQRVYKNSMRF